MRREDLARRLAEDQRTSQAKAQDRVDAIVHRIVRDLRRGETVHLPGLGRLLPGTVASKAGQSGTGAKRK